MASEKDPLDAYLTGKTAGALGDAGRGLMSGLRSGVGMGNGFDRGLTGLGHSIGEGAARGGLAAGGALALAGATSAVSKLYDAATKTRDFKSMLMENPDLESKHDENPRLFNQMFSTLRTFNPSFSKDPIVAGSYMRQMMDDPMTAGGKVVETLNFRDKMPGGLGEKVMRTAFSGAKAPQKK